VKYPWKALDEGYNFALDLTSIRSLSTKLWVSKVADSQFREFRDSQGTKCHLDAGPMAKHRIYYKEKGGGFPQIRAMVNLVNMCLPVVCPCNKSVQTTH